MPQTLALRHVAFEDLGLLGPLLERRGHAIRYVDVPVAALDDVDPLAPDLLVILGGPIGVYENESYPFIDAERTLIAARVAARLPTLGICLGSQLIASALGARVYPSGVKEIGWAPLTLTAAGRASCLAHLEDTAVLHWHGDTFELPDGATLLASTPLCKHQAFSLDDRRTLALQFHAETAGRALESWLVGHTAEIAATEGISVRQLRADTARCSAAVVRRGAQYFDAWLDSVGVRGATA